MTALWVCTVVVVIRVIGFAVFCSEVREVLCIFGGNSGTLTVIPLQCHCNLGRSDCSVHRQPTEKLINLL